MSDRDIEKLYDFLQKLDTSLHAINLRLAKQEVKEIANESARSALSARLDSHDRDISAVKDALNDTRIQLVQSSQKNEANAINISWQHKIMMGGVSAVTAVIVSVLAAFLGKTP